MALSSVASATRRNLTLGLLAVALLAQGIFVGWAATGEKPHAAWERLVSTPLWPAYGDLRVVTEGWEEVAAGFDPLRLDADSPLYNYPRLWLAGARLGWTSADAPWLGAVVTGSFLLAVFAVLRIAPGWTRVLAIGVMVSPPVWLGLERGNTDLLLFALLTPALLAAPRPGWHGVWPPLAILLAAMLKLYPAVLLAAGWARASRAGRWLLAVAALVFVAYLAGTRADVHAALAKTMKGTEESYGVPAATDKLASAWSASDRANVPASDSPAQRVMRWLVVGLIASVTLAAFKPAWGGAQPVLGAVPEAAARLFLGGAAIYLATFLVGQNWVYRLVFLLWTLPFLGHAAATGNVRARAAAGGTLGVIVLFFWLAANHGAVAGWTAQLASVGLVLPLAWFAAGLLRPAENAPARGWKIAGDIAPWAAATLGCAVAGAGFFSRPADEAWRLVRFGEAQTREGDLAGAAANFEQALRLWPDYSDAHDQYGVMLWTAGRADEAVAHFERAIELAPSSTFALNNLGGARRGQRRWADAIALHQAALAIRPRDVVTYNHLALAYLGARRPAEALAPLEEALRLEPGNALTERNLATALAAAGQREKSLPHFAQALQLSPEYAEAEMQWGIVLASLGQLPEAVVHLERAATLDPQSAPAHFFASRALRDLGRVNEADAHYREALRLDPALGRR